MTERLTKLTPEQEAMLPAIRDEWIAAGLSTEPADRPRAERGVRMAYSAAGLEPPEIIVWLDSPLQGAFGQALVGPAIKSVKAQVRDQFEARVWSQVLDQVRDQVEAQVRDQVWDQVGDQVSAQVHGQVRSQVEAQVQGQVSDQVWDRVRDQVWDQVRDQVSAQVRDRVWDQVWDQVRDQVQGQVSDQVADRVTAQVWDQVWDQVGAQVRDQVWSQVQGQVSDRVQDQVWDQVRAQVEDRVVDRVSAQVRSQVTAQIEAQVWSQVRFQVEAQVRDQVRKWSGGVIGCWSAGWLAHLITCGALAGLDVSALDGLAEVERSAGMWWPMQGVAVVTERPELIARDKEGRLHNPTGPAVRYRDGFSVYAWHGTRVPADLVEGDGWSVERILAEKNAEVRRCAIERMGWDVFIEAAALRPVGDPVPDPGNHPHTIQLFDLPADLADMYDEPARIMLCTNGSPERDGTRHRFGLVVPGHHTDPVEAAADLYGIPPQAYRDLEVRR